MAMGTRKQRERQQDLWIATSDVVRTPGNAFYERLNAILDQHQFDRRVEFLCRKFYKKSPYGRPSMAPGVYFRTLLIGYFEGLDSERGIAWRAADSLSLRRFLGYALDEDTPDHSTISRTRRLYWLETHKAVFRWVVRILADEGLLSGQTVAIDATTLEANAALKSIVRRDNGQSYEEYLKGSGRGGRYRESDAGAVGAAGPQAEEERLECGMEEPERPRCADYENEGRADASGAQSRARRGSGERGVAGDDGAAGQRRRYHDHPQTLAEGQEAAREINERGIEEVVADKGYHSGAVLQQLHEEAIRSYIPEPERGRRNWQGRRQSERAETGLCQSPTHPRGAEQATAESTQRVGGENLRPPVRDRRACGGCICEGARTF